MKIYHVTKATFSNKLSIIIYITGRRNKQHSSRNPENAVPQNQNSWYFHFNCRSNPSNSQQRVNVISFPKRNFGRLDGSLEDCLQFLYMSISTITTTADTISVETSFEFSAASKQRYILYFCQRTIDDFILNVNYFVLFSMLKQLISFLAAFKCTKV